MVKIFSKSSPFKIHQWYLDVLETGGVVLIDKPLEWSSFDVVAKLRNRLRHQLQHITGEPIKRLKVGHAGTLDVLASGLLIVAVGKATKQIDHFMGLEKTYVAKIKLGATTKTYDAEGEEENLQSTNHITPQQILDALNQFTGEINQVPPMYSAIKKDGKRLYALARAGKEIERAPRPITIHRIELTELNLPDMTLHVECSKGTYIRSLAHDIGSVLNVGGYLTGLKRTHIGEYNVADAFTVDEFLACMSAESID